MARPVTWERLLEFPFHHAEMEAAVEHARDAGVDPDELLCISFPSRPSVVLIFQHEGAEVRFGAEGPL